MDVRLALTGFGNVGQEIANLISSRGDLYDERYGLRLILTGVADRGGMAIDKLGLDPDEILRAKREHGSVAAHARGRASAPIAEFLESSNAMVLIEVSSTNFVDAEPGWTYIREAMERNMGVVMASKGALVLHWNEMKQAADGPKPSLYFSGAVGAPLPVMELHRQVLVGNNIAGFEGIVNGTNNQILAAMSAGASYEDGVKQAQDAGIAETDPTLDVDGWDAAAKAVIISNAVLGTSLTLSDVERVSVRSVSAETIENAASSGHVIKYVARVMRTPKKVGAWVGPEKRPSDDPLGKLNGPEMGIVFFTDLLGRVVTTIQESAGNPTALTVLRDVVNLARNLDHS